MSSYAEFYRRSIDQRDIFWAEQARLIDWNEPPQQVCDYSNPPFARRFGCMRQKNLGLRCNMRRARKTIMLS